MPTGKLALLCCLGALLISASGFAGVLVFIEEKTPEQLFLEKCPKDAANWAKWRDLMADEISLVRIESGQGARYYLRMLGCLSQSKALFDESPQLAACTEDLEHYLRATSHVRTSEAEDVANAWRRDEKKKTKPFASWRKNYVGMNVPDWLYYKLTGRYTAVPKEIESNQEFLDALNKYETLPKAMEKLDEMNASRREQGVAPMEYFIFHSEVPTKDTRSEKRLLIYVPGNPERWISLGIPEEKLGPSGQSSMVAVYTDGQGRRHTYFKDHWRDIDKDGHTHFRHVTEGIFTDGCFECHKSGALLIRPRSEIEPRFADALKRVNRRIYDIGLTDGGGFYRPDLFGIGLGPVYDDAQNKKYRSPDFFNLCGNNALVDQVEKEFGRDLSREEFNQKKAEVFKEVRLDVLRKAMSCTTCHDGTQRGLLTPPFRDLITRYVDDEQMPPKGFLGTKLTPLEKNLLSSCLDADYYGIKYANEKKPSFVGALQRFLVSTPCGPAKHEDSTAVKVKAASVDGH